MGMKVDYVPTQCGARIITGFPQGECFDPHCYKQSTIDHYTAEVKDFLKNPVRWPKDRMGTFTTDRKGKIKKIKVKWSDATWWIATLAGNQIKYIGPMLEKKGFVKIQEDYNFNSGAKIVIYLRRVNKRGHTIK